MPSVTVARDTVQAGEALKLLVKSPEVRPVIGSAKVIRYVGAIRVANAELVVKELAVGAVVSITIPADR